MDEGNEMTVQIELDLSIDVGQVPLDIFRLTAATGSSYQKDADDAFPVEHLDGGVSIRHIERGVWLWGVVWWNGKNGEGFSPLRKWGHARAAMSREAAIVAARLYIAERMHA